MEKEEKYGFVYIWRDRKHKRYYIGCHWGTEDDGYICSSRWMRKSYRRRPNDFKRRIIISNIKSRLETFIEEQRWLSFIKDEELGKRYYNLTKCYDNHFSIVENKRLTMAEKISKSLKGKPGRRKGTKQSDEAKNKIILALKKRIRKPWPEEFIKKLSESRKGINNPNYGKKHNEKLVKCTKCGFESRPSLISRFHNDNCKMVDWDYIKFEYETKMISIRELERKYDLSHKTISVKAKKENWSRTNTKWLKVRNI